LKTIIILIDQLYLHGGIEKLVAIKANYWTDKFGYHVVIVSTEQQQKPFVYELSEKIEFIDINVNFHRSISFFHPRNFKKIYYNIRELKKIFERKKPDYILVASHIPMTYILPFIKTDAKIIKEFHYSKYKRKQNTKEKFFTAIEGRYDYLVVLSDEEKLFYPSNNVQVIPNPVINLPADKLYTDGKKNIAGAILRFAPVKQIEKMVEIWELFYRNNKDWKLYIYGATGNDYSHNIKTLIEEKSLEHTIIFKGQTENVGYALSEIKILLMTSANECFPMVILEANSCGVPVISFDSPTGPRNIITHNVDGILVPLNDCRKFAEELQMLVTNEKRFENLSSIAVETAGKYLIDGVMAQWQNKIFKVDD